MFLLKIYHLGYSKSCNVIYQNYNESCFDSHISQILVSDRSFQDRFNIVIYYLFTLKS
jgi:hypothetical protein